MVSNIYCIRFIAFPFLVRYILYVEMLVTYIVCNHTAYLIPIKYILYVETVTHVLYVEMLATYIICNHTAYLIPINDILYVEALCDRYIFNSNKRYIIR